MARWTDIATWVGPTVNQGGRMIEQRGLVVHTAVGSFEGTKAWQKNPDANVSSHFIVAYDGRIAQMVDTDVTAWTQKAGNGHWLSVENEGDTTKPLTAAQVAANARILRKAHEVYGVPLQLATSPTGRGLGHHSMGAESGVDWGHSACPGVKIKAQKPAILAAAIGEDDMELIEKAWLYNASSISAARARMQDTAPVKDSANQPQDKPLVMLDVKMLKDLDARVNDLAARPPVAVDAGAVAAALAGNTAFVQTLAAAVAAQAATREAAADRARADVLDG